MASRLAKRGTNAKELGICNKQFVFLYFLWGRVYVVLCVKECCVKAVFCHIFVLYE